MPSNSQVGLSLLFLGIAIAFVGLIVLVAPSISWLGKLPGDIRIERDNVRFYFPLTTSILLSILLTLIAWMIQFFQRQ